MQVSIARQLSLQPTTVGNFFMNARRRLQDKWKEGDYDLGGYNDDTMTISEAEGEANQLDEYNDRNQITINQELLVPELLQQHLAQPSQHHESHQNNMNINSINQHQQHGSGVHPSLSDTQSNICNIIPVTQVTNQEIITNSSIADQIVPINTHHEISHMQKDSISVITSDNIDCSNVPEVTATIDDRINVLNPNPHHSVYSLTSL
jgi:hypothetical protein